MVNQAEYVIHVRVVAPQEYVSIYSTRRIGTHTSISDRQRANRAPASG